MVSSNAPNIDAYIAGFPENIQLLLEQMRQTIRQAAPGAEECIKYAMPTYVWHGNLVYFAAFKNHIGLYDLPSGSEAFREELAVYKTGKGSIQFPIDTPLPLNLISRMVACRVKENEEKALKKKTQRTCTNGHKYYKSSDCPTCPTCEAQRKTPAGFLNDLAAPARRALENNGLTDLAQLALRSEKEVLAFHGLGQSALPKLREALAAQGLTFKK